MGALKMQNRAATIAPVLLALLAVTACGRGPELVDRTQANYVSRADLLDGTWYIRDTVVGVPSTSAITFEGYQGAVDKVRFEIQEQHLVAYRTYEWYPGSDAQVDKERSTIGNVVTVEGKPYRGAPVAAWRITSHFDRIREYNPATGEQSNVLVENVIDRPWYERDFIRVDWGRNAVTNWQGIGPARLAGRGNTGTFNSWVQPIDQEPGDDALVTAYGPGAEGKQQLEYFDFTVRQYWDPPTYNYPGYGEIPYCWMAPTVDCRGAVVKVRTSLRRVDQARVRDYEPLVYDDRMMKKFGYFRQGWGMERPTYDRNHGATLSGRLMYAKRHNIWERAHNAAGERLAVEQRQPRPIVYYVSSNFPAELWESARQIEQSWDGAFRKAVAVPRGLEVSQVPQMFYVCENPVPANAPAACGKEGLHVRMGDLRYSMFNWVNHPQMAGPLGYGPSGADPETGEIIQAVANMYGASLDTFAGSTLQLLDVLTGDLSIDELIAGKDVRSFLADNRKPTDPRRADGPASSSSGLTADATQKSGSFGGVTGELKSRMEALRTKGSLPPMLQDRRAVTSGLIAQNPMLEDAVINVPEVRAAVLAAAPGDSWRQRLLSDPGFYRQVARETMLRFDELTKLEEQRQFTAGLESIWLAEFSDGAYIQMANEMKALFEQKVTQYQSEGMGLKQARALAKTDAWTRIRNSINRFVGEHEVGHTIGLTHNFIGSFDAMNFRDEFWQLRKETIGVMAGGQRVLPITAQDLVDASRSTQRQLDAGMQGYEYSTVMDYMARFPIHSHGVGKYDEAAILFGYSGGHEPGWVEVFNETRADTDPNAWAAPNNKIATTNALQPFHVRGAHSEIPLAHVEHWTPYSTFYSDRFHYTTLPFHFSDSHRDLSFEQALDQGIERMKSRSYRKFSDFAESYATIEKKLHEYNLAGKGDLMLRLYDRTPPENQKAAEVVAAAARDLPVEVPYMYCSDYERGANLGCNLWDSGADVYEMTRDWIERYNEYYVFSNFRRDRLFYSPFNVMVGKYNRFLGNLPNAYHHWLFNIFWYQDAYDMSTEEMHEFFGGPDVIYQNYWTMAVVDGLNHLVGELAQPAAGYFGKDRGTTRWTHLKENNPQNTRLSSGEEDALKSSVTSGAQARYDEVVYVPRGPGRNQYTLYDNDGYDFWRRPNELGHFWDQYAALIALMQSQTSFIGVDRGADETRYSLPYFMTFPEELSNIISGVWLEDNARYASALVKTQDGLADVKLPNMVRGEKYVLGFNYPPAPVNPVNGNPVVSEPVEASPTWSTRFYSQLFGMAYFTDVYNLDFADQNKVFRLGSSEHITPAAGFELVTFADPFGGGYYYAALQKVGEAKPAAASWQVKRAEELRADWAFKVQQSTNPALTPAERAEYEQLAAEYEGKVRDSVRNLELMRGMYSVFGNAW